MRKLISLLLYQHVKDVLVFPVAGSSDLVYMLLVILNLYRTRNRRRRPNLVQLLTRVVCFPGAGEAPISPDVGKNFIEQ